MLLDAQGKSWWDHTPDLYDANGDPIRTGARLVTETLAKLYQKTLDHQTEFYRDLSGPRLFDEFGYRIPNRTFGYDVRFDGGKSIAVPLTYREEKPCS